MKKRCGGFTFIEALVVMALFAVISVSLFQSFTMGLKVWKRASRPDIAYRKAVLNLERFTEELRCSRPYPNTSFMGEEGALAFTSIIYGDAYKMTYRFYGRRLWRSAEVVERPSHPSGEWRELVSDLRCGEFRYYGVDVKAPRGEFAVFKKWNGSIIGPPVAVGITMVLKDGTRLEKIVSVPVQTQLQIERRPRPR